MMLDANAPVPKYISLVGLPHDDVLLLLRGLGALVGEVDDVDTLTRIDELQKKIQAVVRSKGQLPG